MDGWMGGWLDVCDSRWVVVEWTNAWISGFMEGWKVGR